MIAEVNAEVVGRFASSSFCKRQECFASKTVIKTFYLLCLQRQRAVPRRQDRVEAPAKR